MWSAPAERQRRRRFRNDQHAKPRPALWSYPKFPAPSPKLGLPWISLDHAHDEGAPAAIWRWAVASAARHRFWPGWGLGLNLTRREFRKRRRRYRSATTLL